MAGAVEGAHVVAVGDGLSAEGADGVDDLAGRTGRAALAVELGPDVVDHDARSLTGELEGVGPADPTPGAGHDDHPPVADAAHPTDPLLKRCRGRRLNLEQLLLASRTQPAGGASGSGSGSAGRRAIEQSQRCGAHGQHQDEADRHGLGGDLARRMVGRVDDEGETCRGPTQGSRHVRRWWASWWWRRKLTIPWAPLDTASRTRIAGGGAEAGAEQHGDRQAGEEGEYAGRGHGQGGGGDEGARERPRWAVAVPGRPGQAGKGGQGDVVGEEQGDGPGRGRRRRTGPTRWR